MRFTMIDQLKDEALAALDDIKPRMAEVVEYAVRRALEDAESSPGIVLIAYTEAVCQVLDEAKRIMTNSTRQLLDPAGECR